MKQTILFLLALLFPFFYPMFAHSSPEAILVCEDGTKRAQLINKFNLEPRDARGEIEYCTKGEGAFKARVILHNLTPNSNYVLSLNGKVGAAGNGILRRYNHVRGKCEGYIDIEDAVRTNERGHVNKLVRRGLPPSGYDVKFLIKDVANNYAVILLNDNISFEVMPNPRISITDPQPDAEIELTAIVRGNVSDRNLNVYVFVHPLLTDKWWVQRLPSPPNEDGSWQTLCYFGTKKLGIGEYFEIVAIAQTETGAYQEGQQLSMEEMQNILRRFLRSDVLTVKRVR